MKLKFKNKKLKGTPLKKYVKHTMTISSYHLKKDTLTLLDGYAKSLVGDSDDPAQQNIFIDYLKPDENYRIDYSAYTGKNIRKLEKTMEDCNMPEDLRFCISFAAIHGCDVLEIFMDVEDDPKESMYYYGCLPVYATN